MQLKSPRIPKRCASTTWRYEVTDMQLGGILDGEAELVYSFVGNTIGLQISDIDFRLERLAQEAKIVRYTPYFC